MPVINSFGVVEHQGVPYSQALTNAAQSKNVRETPASDAGIIAPPVQSSIGKRAEAGDTTHSGGGLLASMRRIFWPGRSQQIASQEQVTAASMSGVEQWDRNGLDARATPARIARRNVLTMGLNAGLQQHGSQQSNHHAFLPPPVIPSGSRGIRSVGAVTGRIGASADTMHVPGVFVPRQVS